MMNRLTNDDLFEGSTMSFGEHLEELRVCLFKSVMGLAIGVAVGFYFANRVVNFFQQPLENALEKYDLEVAEERLVKEQKAPLTPEQRRTLWESRLIREVLLLDMDRFADAVAGTYPELPRQSLLRRHAFTSHDLRPGRERELAQALIKTFGADAKENSKSLLSEDQQATLKSLAGKSSELSNAEQQELVAVLNALIDDPALAEQPGLSANAPKPTSSEESASDHADPEGIRLRNKTLLANTFKHELLPPQISLMELSVWRPARVKFQVLTAEEAFMIWMKAGIVTGIVVASPWIFYQIWIFVAAGLYPHEKNYVYIFLPISMLLFFAGASLAFWFVFEPVLNFLFQFQKEMNATFEPRIGEWLSFVLILPIGFGISFQLPLVMLFINRLGIIDVSTYTANWRVSILAIFLISMVLTPADPISMLLMAVPLCFLYVLGILLCMWMPRSRSPFGEVYEP